MPGSDGTGSVGRGPMTGRATRGRRGLGGGFASGPGGECICPNCDYRELHQLGVSCHIKKCPKCGATMTRE